MKNRPKIKVHNSTLVMTYRAEKLFHVKVTSHGICEYIPESDLSSVAIMAVAKLLFRYVFDSKWTFFC